MKLDDRLKELDGQWSVTRLITPINIQDSYEDRMLVNWVPQYKEVEFDRLLDAYNEVLENIDSYEFDEKLRIHYVAKINECLEYLTAFKDRDPMAITNIHGITDLGFLLKHKKRLDEICEQTINYTYPTNTYTPEYATGYLQSVLDQRHLPYSCETRDIIAKVTVQHSTNKVYINGSATYGRNELRRLTEHEIGTHIVRAMAGSEKGYLFKKGFAKYIELEEGLAIYSEVEAGYPEGLVRTYLRLVATNLCMENTFEDMYKKMCDQFPNIDKQQIYDICFRIKRGLANFNDFGGYTKDRLYITGYLKLCDMTRSKRKIEKIRLDGKTNFDYYNIKK